MGRGVEKAAEKKRRLEIQDGKHMPSHGRQTFSWQSISLTSLVSDNAECAQESLKPCVAEDLRLSLLCQACSVSLGEMRRG